MFFFLERNKRLETTGGVGVGGCVGVCGGGGVVGPTAEHMNMSKCVRMSKL